MKTKTTPPRRDHYREVADKIIAALEAGTKPWIQPWVRPESPRNGATGHRYRGINRLMLEMTQTVIGSQDPRWCSYRQALQRGWQVRRGEKGTAVFFFKTIDLDADEGEPGEETRRRVPFLRASTVFHTTQIDGIPPYEAPKLQATPWRLPDAAAIVIRNSLADIRYGGSEAYYEPLADFIQIPAIEAFTSETGLVATVLHELAHWSGSAHRLNRDLSGRFGSPKYSEEELIAEITAANLCAELGIPYEVEHHASYLGFWLKQLKNDPKVIFRAAASAQRASDFLLGFHPDYAASLVANDGDDDTDADLPAVA